MTSETDAEIVQHVRLMDTPTDADSRRRYTEAQLEMAIRLARRGAAMQWRPIETAPASGEYLEYQPPCMSGRSFLPARVIKCGESGPMRKSTHWMPLPPPPAGEQEHE